MSHFIHYLEDDKQRKGGGLDDDLVTGNLELFVKLYKNLSICAICNS